MSRALWYVGVARIIWENPPTVRVIALLVFLDPTLTLAVASPPVLDASALTSEPK